MSKYSQMLFGLKYAGHNYFVISSRKSMQIHKNRSLKYYNKYTFCKLYTNK